MSTATHPLPATGSTNDPYVRTAPGAAIHFLPRLNPLAKLLSPVPAMALLIFVRDAVTPASFIAFAALLILIGVRITPRVLAVLAAVPLGVMVIGVGFSLWTDAAQVDDTAALVQIGGWTLYSGAFAIGFATGLRIAAIVMLTLIAGLSTTGPDLVRATVQQLRVPYRIGYTALAAFRFVPRFAHELDVIRQAHRVRGAHGGHGPFAAIARWVAYVVPLLAGAIRHAERVALAMDARAFGAHADRTERHLVPWRVRDTVFVIAFVVASTVIFALTFPWGLA